MNPKQLVRLSNIIGILAIVLLIYWVFSFMLIEVFELKIFRKNLTETFYISILGILALMAGALMINVMFNLTRIAQKHNNDAVDTKTTKRVVGLMLGSFPILALLLFAGDYVTSKKKEKLLVQSVAAVIKTNVSKSHHMLNYTFDDSWIVKTGEILEILSKTDEHLSDVTVLVKDSINNEPVFLGFTQHYVGALNDTATPRKKHFIRKTTQAEREYLNHVFDHGKQGYRYSAHDGKYELFYPYVEGQKRIVIYLSKYRKYGKIGR